MDHDPGECRNLMENPLTRDAKEAKESLKKELVKHEFQWGIKGTIQNDDFIKLEPFVPKPYRNHAFPLFPSRLTNEEEKTEMNSHLEEVIAVTRNEPAVHFEDLDLKAWQQNGNYTDEQISELLNREREYKK